MISLSACRKDNMCISAHTHSHDTHVFTVLRPRLSGNCRQLLNRTKHTTHHLRAESSSKHAKISARTPAYASTRLKRWNTSVHANCARPHAPLFDAASAIPVGSSSARSNGSVIICGDTAAEKQHCSVSVDSREEKALRQGWRREAPFHSEWRQTTALPTTFRPWWMQCHRRFQPLSAWIQGSAEGHRSSQPTVR